MAFSFQPDVGRRRDPVLESAMKGCGGGCVFLGWGLWSCLSAHVGMWMIYASVTARQDGVLMMMRESIYIQKRMCEHYNEVVGLAR